MPNMPPNHATVPEKPLNWKWELLDSMKTAIETTVPYQVYTNPIVYSFLFGVIRGYTSLLAYKEAPSAVRQSMLDLGEVANILHRLKSASPRLPAELNNVLESAVVECQKTSLQLLKALKPYTRERKGELSERRRLRWALLDCERIDVIRKSLLPQKKSLELIVTTIAMLSPSARANDSEDTEIPPGDGISLTTTSENTPPSSIPPSESEDLSEEDIQYIDEMLVFLELRLSDKDHNLKSTRADSFVEEASFFHSPYASSVAQSDNASHFYDQDSLRPSANASRSMTFLSSTDSLQRKSRSLVRLPRFRNNTGSTSAEVPLAITDTTPGKAQDGPVAAIRSLINRKKSSSTNSLNQTTEHSLERKSSQ